MAILKIQDTEAFQADYLRNLYGLVRSGITTYDDIEYNIVDSRITSENLMPVKTESIEIIIPPSFPAERVDQIVSEMQGFSLLTHKTTITTPDEDIDENTFNYNNYATDAFSFYNIRNEEYEDYTQTNDERILPNFCLGALWTRSGETEEQRQYYSMFGTKNSLLDTDMLAGSTPINNYEFDDEFLVYGESAELKMDYFKNLLANAETTSPQYQSANTHVYVDFNYNLNDSEQIGNTPFFNRIRLPQLKINNRFETEDTEISMHSMFTDSKMSEKLIKSFRNSNSFLRSFRLNEGESELKVYDLMEYFESIAYSSSLADSDEMYLRDANSDMIADDNSPFLFYFYKLILLGKIRRKIRSRSLSFEELIINNTDHHTEQIGFKVIKRIEGRNTPIQTFYFLNRSGLQDFIDTQIKFDRVYTYEVITMTVIYGSSYSYQNVVKTRDGALLESETIIRFDFVNTPSVKIVEVPLAFHTLRVVEPPPIVPEITFYNEMTSRNKLKIRMEHQDGNIVDEYLKKPLRPFGDNQGYIDKLEQYFSSSDVLVTSGKTSDGVYEIYRLEEPPESYKDFEGALITTVQSNIVYENGESSRNAMFVDLISHQKKYYYAFRVLTHRGNPSELSPIYVAEMYEDADETFLTFDLYQEPEIKDSQNIYNMRKYIQILPNFEQTVANEQYLLNTFTSAESAVDFVSLGDDELQEQLWEYNKPDKYIKLRLESKSSGRKMDINLYFKIKKPTN